MMKRVFSICLLSNVACAAPILNLSGPALNMTAFPDNQDPNLYYLAPTEMILAHDDAGVPEFSYMEEWNFWGDKGVVQTTMVPAFNPDQLASAQKNILSVNPRAHFASLPFVNSSVIFDPILVPYVEANDCNHPAGVVGQEESCSFELTSQGAMVMRSSFKTGLTLTMQFQYSVEGVIQKPDKSYEAETHTYQVAGLLGGAELAKYPQLFRGADGKESF